MSAESWFQRYTQRWSLVGSLMVPVLVLWTLLRLVLFAVFKGDGGRLQDLGAILTRGALFDLLAGLSAFFPLVAGVSLLRLRWLDRPWIRRLLFTWAFFLICFDVFVQYFFFEEYNARYNHLALDYLMYPDEVFGNILASYNVPLFVGLALAGGIGLAWWSARRAEPVFGEWRWSDRLRGGIVVAVLAAVLWGAWSVAPVSAHENRVAGEIALNGWAQLIRAYLTSHLDYDAYYALVPPADARVRVARIIGQPNPDAGLVRHFTPRGRPAGSPLDIVILIEESLGSEFSARFGHQTVDPVTPELDRWSHEGLALTNLVANGNRTVRGLEGILCSFLPLPGDAVIKRNRSENIASIAQVLAARGYQTTYLVGGYGLFDSVKPFMTRNGFQSFVEQPDYPDDAFRTIWGVADEFVFNALLERQLQARKQGQRFFGTAMTGSNHKPFDVPPGRVSWPPGGSRRRGAVLYADWAIGHYLTRAREEGLLEHTVVLVVGDHGARVYGAEQIPVASYRVPAVFFTPDPALRGRTIDRLISQVDLAPTLLSLAGIEYDAPFFGQDLLGLPDDGGRAFVNHNRAIGMLNDTGLVVLGLHRRTTFYTRPDRSSNTFTAVAGDSSPLQELAADAQAAFQTAYQVYQNRAYTLPRPSIDQQ